ncbi:MAG: hypothetical protein ACYDED_06060 [Ferrimicrobium sp.]
MTASSSWMTWGEAIVGLIRAGAAATVLSCRSIRDEPLWWRNDESLRLIRTPPEGGIGGANGGHKMELGSFVL